MKKNFNTLCECGCGNLAPIAKYTYRKRGWKMGFPKRFIRGHNRLFMKISPPMLGKKHSIDTRKKMSISARKGSDSNMWKGGVYKKHDLLRRSSEYRLWRESIFKRDNWTCVWCGHRGGKLNADHIRPFSIYINLRFDINNGRTLCVGCHKKTDTYGYNKKYYKWLEDVKI